MFLLDIEEIWMKKDGGRAKNMHGVLYNMKIKTKPNQLFLFLHFQSHFHGGVVITTCKQGVGVHNDYFEVQ